MEADAVVGLALQLRVAQAIPCLEDQQFHHHHWVHVGSASSWALVGVEALDDGCECVPVYEWFYFGEFVSEFLDFFVGFSVDVGVEGFHVLFQVQVINKPIRGGENSEKQRLIEILCNNLIRLQDGFPSVFGCV